MARSSRISDFGGADDGYNLVVAVQDNLMKLGLYPGPADGIGGVMTRDAVRSYQGRHDLSVNGEITKDLLAHMTRAQNFAAIGAKAAQE